MKSRKIQITLVGCLTVVLVSWILSSSGKESTDKETFSEMLSAEDWSRRLNSAQKWLPGPLSRLPSIAKLNNRYSRKAEQLEEALLASGFLTNAWLRITNMPVTVVDKKTAFQEVQRRLNAGVRGADWYHVAVGTNEVWVTCRTGDLALIRRAIEKP